MANERKSIQKYLDKIELIETDIFHIRSMEKRRLAAEVHISFYLKIANYVIVYEIS